MGQPAMRKSQIKPLNLKTHPKAQKIEKGNGAISDRKNDKDDQFFCILLSKTLVIYKAATLQKLTEISTDGTLIRAEYSSTLLTRTQRFFVTGSCEYDGGKSNTNEVDLKTFDIFDRANMQKPRYQHGFVELKQDFLLVVGGVMSSSFLHGTGQLRCHKSCEMYNVTFDKWKPIDTLNHERRNPMTMVFDDSIVYAFGGIGGHDGIPTLTPIYSFERIILKGSAEGSRWEVFILDQKKFHIGIGSCLKIDENRILLFQNENKKKKESVSLIFNRDTQKLKSSGYKLSTGDDSYVNIINHVYYHKGKHYAFTNLGDLSVFDNKRWVTQKGFIA